MDRASVAVAVVGSRIEAELIASLLRSHGIDAFVMADDVGGMDPQLQLGGVSVLVVSADAMEAKQILRAKSP